MRWFARRLCALKGHDWMLRFGVKHLYLQCQNCRQDSPGVRL
jgi:hypothetical protein